MILIMFWIFLLLIGLMVLGCYCVYKEAKQHELHRLRAEFGDLRDRHETLVREATERDPEMLEYFKGELTGIDEALDILKREDTDYDVIQEIEDDLKRLKDKVASVFKGKE